MTKKEPLPDWFRVGARLKFRGGEDTYTVTRIDLVTGLWDASNSSNSSNSGNYRFPIFVVHPDWGDWEPTD